MPMQETYCRLKVPSADVSPNLQPAAFSNASATAGMPCCFSTTALQSRTTVRPRGVREKK